MPSYTIYFLRYEKCLQFLNMYIKPTHSLIYCSMIAKNLMH